MTRIGCDCADVILLTCLLISLAITFAMAWVGEYRVSVYLMSMCSVYFTILIIRCNKQVD